MVQGYYTLQEAAQVLGLAPEELKQMAQRNQIRSFQDRGTWRFRVQDIQELARQRGAASDLELVLGEANIPRSIDSPAPKSPTPKGSAPKSTPPKSGGPKSPTPKSPTPKSPQPQPPKSAPPRSGQSKLQPQTPKTPKGGSQEGGDVFDFVLDEHVGVGRENLESPSGRAKARPDSKRGPGSPPPAGSDSDVRLVSDGGDQFVFDAPKPVAGSDSDVKLVGSDIGARKSPSGPPQPPSGRKSGADSPVPKAGPKTPPPVGDSGVRLVPMDSDSDVKIVGAGSDEVPLGELGKKSPTDSDIRLEAPPSNLGRSDEGLLTEEINLDEELKKQEAQRQQQKPQAKVKPKSKLPKMPTASPFELSESQLQVPQNPPPPAAPGKVKPDSSDFDLTPSKPDSSDFDLSPAPSDSSSDDFSLELPEESDISLAPGSGSSGELKGPSSGISLENPVDKGISLEQGGEGSDEIEFELSLDAESTPKPAADKAKSSGESSEFELNLDLEGPASQESASDSEFELTLDDSGGLAPLEAEAPQLKAGQDKDIFETDFEVPALEEESGSQVAAIDTDLDSSDFDLALGDSEVAAEEESGSQVVALDEEAADEGAATVAAKRQAAAAAGVEAGEVGFDEIGGEAAPEIEIEEGEEAAVAVAGGPVREVVREKVLKPAPWGVLPVVFMLPCVVVMFLVGIMGFELVQHMNGYQPPGFVTKTITELIGQKPK